MKRLFKRATILSTLLGMIDAFLASLQADDARERPAMVHLGIHGADLGGEGGAAFRKVRFGSQPRLHLRRPAQHHVAARRQRAIRESLGHAGRGSLPEGR
jgi:hypothetical protein